MGRCSCENPALYTKISPVAYSKHANMPTLTQHGEADMRVLVSNEDELYRGLKDNGVVTKLAILKGMA